MDVVRWSSRGFAADDPESAALPASGPEGLARESSPAALASAANRDALELSSASQSVHIRHLQVQIRSAFQLDDKRIKQFY